jgi:hypothetical protein
LKPKLMCLSNQVATRIQLYNFSCRISPPPKKRKAHIFLSKLRSTTSRNFSIKR